MGSEASRERSFDAPPIDEGEMQEMGQRADGNASPAPPSLPDEVSTFIA